ncbi:MAG: hypothetical protein ACRDV0_02655 [Acidimicrobiales bacterium]
MTTTATTAAPRARSDADDRRGSWVPTWSMVTTRFMELRKRRGLMIALAAVNIGVPSIFLAIRLIAHAVAPKSYGPAGGASIFDAMVAGVMFVFGFIVAATVGASAGSNDLTEGMFRHLVVTGRSRLAIYLARIPAGLAIVVSMVAVGFTIVCAVCCFAAPTHQTYNGSGAPVGLTRSAFNAWAVDHPVKAICDWPGGDLIVPVICRFPGAGQVKLPPGIKLPTHVTKAQEKAVALRFAHQDYVDYTRFFLSPPIKLMVESGLWIELEAVIGFMVALGLSSLIGSRTVPVVLMIILEVIIGPIFSRNVIPHIINIQRGLVGLATAHIEPSALPQAMGGNNPQSGRILVPESLTVAWLVIAAWIVGWTALGAWRMSRRDA